MKLSVEDFGGAVARIRQVSQGVGLESKEGLALCSTPASRESEADRPRKVKRASGCRLAAVGGAGGRVAATVSGRSLGMKSGNALATCQPQDCGRKVEC